jgi:hypothetical protein
MRIVTGSVQAAFARQGGSRWLLLVKFSTMRQPNTSKPPTIGPFNWLAFKGFSRQSAGRMGSGGVHFKKCHCQVPAL